MAEIATPVEQPFASRSGVIAYKQNVVSVSIQ